MTDHGSYNSKMSAKNILADLYGEYGRYAEAEAMGRDCLAWLRDMPMMGSHSPQALGCERRLMGVIWKQGKYEEAKAMQEELKELVEGLPGTEFEKYLDDERTMLAELVVSFGRVERCATGRCRVSQDMSRVGKDWILGL